MKKRTHITIDKELIKRLDKKAGQLQISRSSLIERLTWPYVYNDEEKAEILKAIKTF